MEGLREGGRDKVERAGSKIERKGEERVKIQYSESRHYSVSRMEGKKSIATTKIHSHEWPLCL